MNCLMNIDVDDLEKAIHFWGNRMTSNATDKTFTGSIPKVYETYLVPLICEPPSRVLEIAAGTGVVTRALLSALPDRTAIVATDLNQAMLDQAIAIGTRRPV